MQPHYNSSNKIVQMAFQLEKLSTYCSDYYEIKPTNWLTKLAWKILLHYKCAKNKWLNKVAYQQVTIDTEQASLKIIREAIDQINRLDMEPKYVYIGREKFFELIGCKEFRLFQSFNLPLKIYNVEVIVIPWMEGILVV